MSGGGSTDPYRAGGKVFEVVRIRWRVVALGGLRVCHEITVTDLSIQLWHECPEIKLAVNAFAIGKLVNPITKRDKVFLQIACT